VLRSSAWWRQAAMVVLLFVRGRLSRRGHLGLSFTIGVLAIAAGLWAFVEIADAVHEQDDIARWDGAVAEWLHDSASAGLTVVMLALTGLGDPVVVIVTGLVLAGLFWKAGERWRALFLFLSVPAGLALNTALKHAFLRARPVFDEPLASAHGYSFPSGHVAGATLLYTAVAVILVRSVRGARNRVRVVAVAGLLIVVVSFTRMYLGVHYLTDVLSRRRMAFSWVALSATLLNTLRRRALRERVEVAAGGGAKGTP